MKNLELAKIFYAVADILEIKEKLVGVEIVRPGEFLKIAQ